MADEGEKTETPHGSSGRGTPTTAVTTGGDIKAPAFSADKPALWFAQLEAQFSLKGVIREIEKFNHAVSHIDTRYAVEVEDLIVSPPVTTPYQALREALINRFSKSKEAKMAQLLDDEQVGDRTPSQFLRHLRALVPGIDEDVLKARWTSRLPEQTRAFLLIQTEASLETLAASADKLHELLAFPRAAVASVSHTPNWESEVAALRMEIAALRSDIRGRSQSRSETGRSSPTHRRRSRSRTPSSFDAQGRCWYHATWGNKAQKCKPGCSQQGNASGSH